MESYFILDCRAPRIIDSDFELDASFSCYFLNLSHSLLRHTLQCGSQKWFTKPILVLTKHNGEIGTFVHAEYDQNPQIILDISTEFHQPHYGSSLQGRDACSFDLFLFSSLKKVVENIENRRRVQCSNISKNILIVIFFTDPCLPENDNYDVSRMFQSSSVFLDLKSKCGQLEIKLVNTIVSQAPGKYDISTYNLKMYCFLDYLRDNLKLEVSYSLLHNSSFHIQEEFRAILSKQIKPIISRISSQTQNADGFQLDVELIPPHIASACITHPGLLSLEILSFVDNTQINLAYIEGFPLIIRPVSLQGNICVGDTERYYKNLASTVSISNMMQRCGLIAVLKCRNDILNSFEYWGMISSSDLTMHKAHRKNVQMMMMRLTDRDSIMHCLSHEEDYFSKHTEDIDHEFDEFDLITKADESIRSSLSISIDEPIVFNPLTLFSGKFDFQINELKSRLYSHQIVDKRNPLSSVQLREKNKQKRNSDVFDTEAAIKSNGAPLYPSVTNRFQKQRRFENTSVFKAAVELPRISSDTRFLSNVHIETRNYKLTPKSSFSSAKEILKLNQVEQWDSIDDNFSFD